MAKMTVYFDPTPTFGRGPRPSKALVERLFWAVAEVEGENPDTAFQLTNSIDRPWYDPPAREVTPLMGPARSMSVGDVVVTDDKRFWLCAPFGWEELTS